MDDTAQPLILRSEFRRRFALGLIATWLIPPATGELGMTFLGFWTLQEAGLSLIRFTGFYIIAFTVIAFVVIRHQVIEPVMELGENQHRLDPARTKRLKAFPWIFWGLLCLYSSFGPATVLLSNAVFQGTEYTLGQYAFSAFGVIPFLLIAAFPLFFYLTDLLGRFLAPRGVMVMVAPLWLKVAVLGMFTPIMIDSILLTYYRNRTGFLTIETIALWLLLLLIAGAGTLVALRTFHQGMGAIKKPLGTVQEMGLHSYPVPCSLDEFGLIACGWADLLESRDRAEHKVRERDNRVRDIIDNTDAVIYIKDREGSYLLVNRRFTQLYGIPHNDAVGKTDHEIFSKEFADRHRKHDLEVIRDEKPSAIQETVSREDGTHTYISQRFPLYDPDRVLYGVCGISTDVSEHKRAEQALRESQHSLSEAQRIAHIGNWDLDLMRNELKWSEEIYRIFELEPQEFGASYEAFLSTVHPDDRKLVDKVYTDSLKTKTPYSFVHRVLLKDGRVKYVNERCETFYDEYGTPLRSIGTVQDITEAKRAEDLQKRYRECLVKLDSQVSQLLRIADDYQQFYDRVCAGTMELVDADVSALPLIDEPGKSLTCVAALGAKMELLNGQTMLMQEGGLSAWMTMHGEPLRISDLASDPRVIPGLARALDVNTGLLTPLRHKDKVIGGLSAFRKGKPFDEIEEQILNLFSQRVSVALENLRLVITLEERVAERTVQLEVANKELDAFAHSVSHDLRSPLLTIDGFSKALLEDYNSTLDDTGRDYLNRVRAATQRMGRLIDDLLGLSHVSRSEMHRETVHLSQLAKAVMVELKEAEPERQVEFIVPEGMVVQGDEKLLRVALVNLLGNAWKFAGRQFRTRIELGVMEEYGKPVYFVRDNGAGFEMAYADKLFGAFQRLHNVKEFPGTGIGLATVQRIIHRHGGRVWAEGAVEQGATFYFTLELK